MVFTFLNDVARNEAVLVGASSVIIAEARNEENPRKMILIRNISPNAADIITVNLGLAATADTGIVLRQYESFTDSTDAGYLAFQAAITAICATANGKLAILER